MVIGYDEEAAVVVIKNEIDTDNVKAANKLIITRICSLFITSAYYSVSL